MNSGSPDQEMIETSDNRKFSVPNILTSDISRSNFNTFSGQRTMNATSTRQLEGMNSSSRFLTRENETKSKIECWQSDHEVPSNFRKDKDAYKKTMNQTKVFNQKYKEQDLLQKIKEYDSIKNQAKSLSKNLSKFVKASAKRQKS
jgi:hypothetical protein